MLIPFLPYAWASTPERLALAAVVTVSFALLARILRGVNWPGAMAGGVACLALFAGAGPGAFAALVALFAATWISTRLGYRRKQELGLAERREGRNARAGAGKSGSRRGGRSGFRGYGKRRLAGGTGRGAGRGGYRHGGERGGTIATAGGVDDHERPTRGRGRWTAGLRFWERRRDWRRGRRLRELPRFAVSWEGARCGCQLPPASWE